MDKKLCTKCNKHEGSIERGGMCVVCYNNELFGNPAAHSSQNQKKDTSMKTSYLVMGLCGFAGLVMGGPIGALVGAGVGYAITALVFIAQDGAKNL